MIQAKGSSFDGASDGTSLVVADVADQTISEYTASGAISEMYGLISLNADSLLAMTITKPTAGEPGIGDDGKTLKIVTRYAHANTITCSGGFMNANASILTMSAAVGAFVQVKAYNGYWYVTDAGTVTASMTGLTQSGTTGLIAIGTKADTAGSGFALSATKFRAMAVYADDGGLQIPTGNSVASFEGRTVIGYSQGNVNMSIGGIEGHVKLAAGITAGSNGCKYGLWGYFETVGTGVVSNLCTGIMAMIDIDSTSAIAAANVASAIYIKSNDLSGGRNATGKAVCIRVDAPGAGNWDAFLKIPAASGLAVANTKLLSAGGDSSTLSHVITIDIGGTTRYIPVLAAVPTT
jgi:hypothetical protein